jgi:hypothetical protein
LPSEGKLARSLVAEALLHRCEAHLWPAFLVFALEARKKSVELVPVEPLLGERLHARDEVRALRGGELAVRVRRKVHGLDQGFELGLVHVARRQRLTHVLP